MLRERGEYKRKTIEFYRAGAGSACQALRNSWSICPCLQPVGNKKELKRRGGWTGLGQATDCRCLYWRGLLVKKVGPHL